MARTDDARTHDVRTYDARRFRRLAAAAGLIGFPLVLVVEAFLPTGSGSPAEAVRLATEQPAVLVADAATLILSAVLTVVGVYGVVHLVRDRGARLAHVGGALLTLGAFGHMAIATLQVIIVGATPGGDLGEMTTMFDRLDQSPVLVLIAPLIMAYGFGVVVSAFAVWRAGLLGAWAPAVAVSALVAHLAPVGDGAAAVVGVGTQVAVLAVYGALGLSVARMRDDEWAPRPVPASHEILTPTAGGKDVLPQQIG